MKTKVTALAAAVALFFVLAGAAAKQAAPALSKDVDAALGKKVELVKKLVKDPAIVGAIEKANTNNASLTAADIAKADKEWIGSKTVTDFMKGMMVNKAAMALMQFQEENEGFPEIFITDKKGLIVAETNKTSDYLQADEDWWVKAYNAGKGAQYRGELEYDDSSKTEVIAIALPVFSADGKTVIGVIKAAVDITAIKAGK